MQRSQKEQVRDTFTCSRETFFATIFEKRLRFPKEGAFSKKSAAYWSISRACLSISSSYFILKILLSLLRSLVLKFLFAVQKRKIQRVYLQRNRRIFRWKRISEKEISELLLHKRNCNYYVSEKCHVFHIITFLIRQLSFAIWRSRTVYPMRSHFGHITMKRSPTKYMSNHAVKDIHHLQYVYWLFVEYFVLATSHFDDYWIVKFVDYNNFISIFQVEMSSAFVALCIALFVLPASCFRFGRPHALKMMQNDQISPKSSKDVVLDSFAVVQKAVKVTGVACISAGLLRPTAAWSKGTTDFAAVREEIGKVFKADPNKGPTLVRLAWHSSGTYDRMSKTGGSGKGTIRFKEELANGGNAGLNKAVDWMEPIYQKVNAFCRDYKLHVFRADQNSWIRYCNTVQKHRPFVCRSFYTGRCGEYQADGGTDYWMACWSCGFDGSIWCDSWWASTSCRQGQTGEHVRSLWSLFRVGDHTDSLWLNWSL